MTAQPSNDMYILVPQHQWPFGSTWGREVSTWLGEVSTWLGVGELMARGGESCESRGMWESFLEVKVPRLERYSATQQQSS